MLNDKTLNDLESYASLQKNLLLPIGRNKWSRLLGGNPLIPKVNSPRIFFLKAY